MAKAGRKSKAEEMGLKALLDKVVSPAARANVIKRLLKLTEADDPKVVIEAIKLLLAYLYGTPKQSVELSGNKHSPIVIEYVNDWRGTADTPASTPPGPDGGKASGAAVQLVIGGAALAQDIGGDGAGC